ncbi:MAG: hypothetical protein R6V62_05775 [Candidatus Fermentibacteraceae bacterium]
MARWSEPFSSSIARFATLFLFMGAALAFRAFFSVQVMPPPLLMQGEATQAYRYSAMISRGEGIPRIDPMSMHPGGFQTGQNSIFEEYIAGGLHRVLGGDFDRFMRLFCLVFPLLAIPGIYLWTGAAGFCRRTALSASALYGILLPAILRARGESLYRETVALPLIIFLGWTLERALRTESGRLRPAVASGLLLFAALASWKVTGFLALFIFAYLLFSRSVPRDPALIVPLGAAQLLASLFLSHMRHDTAILSPASILAVAAMLSCFAPARLRRAIPWAGVLAAVAAAVLLPGEGGHVTAVALAKIRFLFRHPADPLLLSPDARLFWVGGYTSPTPGEFIWLFGPLVLAAIPGIALFLKQARGRLMVPFLFVSMAGYLFFDRLHVFLAVALAPILALYARKRALLPVVFILAGAHSVFAPSLGQRLSEAGLSFRPGASLLTDNEVDGYLRWVKASSDSTGAFLAYWHVSGLTSAYGERPTVLHTFFENRLNRDNIVEFSAGLFQTPEELVSFMEEKEARYLVYQADFLLDLSWQGAAYLGGVTAPHDSSAAFLMHYMPEHLERLALVWQGASIRVFELDGTAVTLPPNPLFILRYKPFFDYETALGYISDPVGTALALGSSGLAHRDPNAASAALLMLSESPADVPAQASVGLLQFLVEAHLAGAYHILDLEGDFEAYLAAWGPDREVRLDLVRLLERAGLRDRALHQYGLAFEEGGAL